MARELAIFAQRKTSKPEGVKVEGLKVRAVDDGYLNGQIVNAGEEFTFNGKIYKGKLPYWMEEVVPGSLAKLLPKVTTEPKVSTASKPAAAKTPAKPAAKAPATKAATTDSDPQTDAEPQNAGDLV